jgi:uncharacterized protein YciI
MPLFALIGRDGPGAAELRKRHRPAHLEHLRPLARAGRVRFVGPLLEGGAPVGSIVVFEAPDLAAARAVAARDPYVVQGVFAAHELRETRDVLQELLAEPRAGT